jgi:hypothetical protein
MKKIFALILLASALSACHINPPKPNPNYVASDEAKITTLVFDNAVFPDTSFKRRELEVYDFKGDGVSKEYIEQSERIRDGLKHRLDTAKLYVLIDDKPFKIYPEYLNDRVIGLKNGDHDHYSITISAWQREIVIDSVQNQTFNFKNLAFHYYYQYILKSQSERIKPHSFVAGVFKMSAIFFNKSRNKAFVHASFICGGTCGMVRDFYLLKKDGEWRIVLDNMVMIS